MMLNGDGILEHIALAFAEHPNAFPRGGALRYPDVLAGWIAGLDANLLPYVTAGAIANDGGHLTLHDKEHIDRVKHIAADLVRGAKIELTPYELVLLICSVYLHDIGNILGRLGHEEKISAVVAAVGKPAGMDGVEMRIARDIARVHGGKIASSSDTISTLRDEDVVYGQKVRSRFLAALLRLADELADDPARANRVALAAGSLPKQAEIYHVFAGSMHSQLPEPDSRVIRLQLEFSDPSLFTRKLGKGDGEMFLLDEVLGRTLKTYTEARYCSRFLRPHLDFERVNVEILIFNGDGPLMETIAYSLTESGYGNSAHTVYSLAPELEKFRGNGRLTGAHLASMLSGDPSPGGA